MWNWGYDGGIINYFKTALLTILIAALGYGVA
jgi:hypothetical protein